MKNDRDFEICPFCNCDLTEGNLMYVEVGCTNYIFYKKDAKMGWIIDNEDDGHDSDDTYYACRPCDQKLPPEYQEYYGNNL